MQQFRSDFLNAMHARGYMYQCTDTEELDGKMASDSVTAYTGFDCTAPCLHLGSLMQVMVLRLLQRCGHRIIVLLGSATTKIGDPSGKEKTRSMLSEAEIASNKAGIMKVIQRFLGTGDNVIVADNAQWMDGVGYLDFLREVGSKFSVNAMLSLDSVKSRLSREQNLSFLEFNYVLVQSYDFVELHRRYGCTVQIGGSDQWGNITSGIDLAKKMGCGQLYGVTTPLLLAKTGEKMGKTAEGAIWLDDDLYSSDNYWQYFRNVPDEDVGRLLRLFTELPLSKIHELEALKGEAINDAKKVLATEATAICHGIEAARRAETRASNIFECGRDEDLESLVLSRDLIAGDISVAKLLCMSAMVESIGAGRRLIQGRGCKINGITVEDINATVSLADFNDGNGAKKYITIFCGKKRRMKVELADEA